MPVAAPARGHVRKRTLALARLPPGPGSAAGAGYTSPMKRVLVVEDDEGLRETVAEILAEAGYAVSSAGDGREALFEADAHRPDVILLDLMMPVMDGWQFRAEQQLRPALAGVPVIVLSACSDLAGTPSLGEVAALFGKPFDIGELLEGIRHHAGADC